MTLAARIFERLGLLPARGDAFLHRLDTLALATPERRRRGARRCPTAFARRALA